jgi:16S rRNA (cytidine1402-2'-O)-methyltransferase
MNGTLYLIPVYLSEETDPVNILPPQTISIIHSLQNFIVENEKSARAFLKAAKITIPQNQLNILVYNKKDQEPLASYFNDLTAGNSVGILTEAGCPGVADPGAELIAEAHRKGIKVVPLIGPSSILLAIMASGFNGQQFTFNGYLPIDKLARSKKIQDLERLAERINQTQLFMETPFRNNQLFDEVIKSCKPDTYLAIATDITDPNEMIKTAKVEFWKKNKPELHKRPTIFSIYRKQ